MVKLTNREFNAIVLDAKDPENKGRYLVRIPLLQPLLSEKRGIWVKNHIHKYRDNTGSGIGRYGQYFPLHPNTRVLVKFYENDFNTGYIDRILDDDIPNSTITGTSEPAYQRGSTELPRKRIPLPFGAKSDRDEIYQVIRTPKYDNLILISEDSAGNPVPEDSIHIYHKRDYNRLVFNKNGAYITSKNKFTQIIKDNIYKEYLKSQYKYTKLDYHSIVENERRDYIAQNYYLLSNKSIYIQANDNAIHLISHGKAGTINITANSFIALSAVERNAIIALYSKNYLGLVSDGYTLLGSNKKLNVVSRGELTISSSTKIKLIAPVIEIETSMLKRRIVSQTNLPTSPGEVLDKTQKAADKNLGKPSSQEVFKQEKELNYSKTLAPGEESDNELNNNSTYSIDKVMKLIKNVLNPPVVEDKPPNTLADIRALKAIRIIPTPPQTIKFEDE